MNSLAAWPSRRWYLASFPGWGHAVVRAKDAQGLEEWRGRDWRVFPGTPSIDDVTDDVGELLASLADPDRGKSCPPRPTDPCVAVVTLDDGLRLALRLRDAPRLAHEAAVVDFDEGVIRDLCASFRRDDLALFRVFFRANVLLRLASPGVDRGQFLREDDQHRVWRVTDPAEADFGCVGVPFRGLSGNTQVQVTPIYHELLASARQGVR